MTTNRLMGTRTRIPRETRTSRHVLTLLVDVDVMSTLKRMSDQVEFEELIALSIEKLLDIESPRVLFDYVYEAARNSSEIRDLPELIRQVQAVDRHISEEYRWMVLGLTFDSDFSKVHRVESVKLDLDTESMYVLFKMED